MDLTDRPGAAQQVFYWVVVLNPTDEFRILELELDLFIPGLKLTLIPFAECGERLPLILGKGGSLHMTQTCYTVHKAGNRVGVLVVDLLVLSIE